MDGKVVVLLRSSSVARAPVYRHLRSLGVILVLVHPFKPLPEFDGIFQHWLQLETDDVARVRTALADFLAQRHLCPDAIVSFDEYAVFQAASLAVDFRLQPVPLPPAAIQENNLKDRFRLFCASHKINSPKSVRLPLTLLPSPAAMQACEETAEASDAAFEALQADLERDITTTMKDAGVDFPVVLKPSPGAGSLLARLCSTAAEAARHVWCMWRVLSNHPDTKHFVALTRGAAATAKEDSSAEAAAVAAAAPYPPSVQILAEEYISGQEVDIDCVVERGVVRFCAISDNFAPAPPFFAEVGGLCPSALGLEGQRALRDLLESYVAACGTDLSGVLHFEAKYDPARRMAYVVEVNCRPGSAETNVMLNTVYREMSLGESLVRCALRLPIAEQIARLYPEVATDAGGGGGDGDEPSGQQSRIVKKPTENALPMWRALGGPARGFYPPQCWAASVNLYPSCAGVLRKARVATEDASLVAFSVSANAGDAVAPPPARFYLLCWMVAHGKTAEEARCNIDRLSASFVQEIEPLS